MRVIHRYLGFFLAGIMIIYALSGIVLIYRNTNLFKVDTLVEKQLEPNLDEKTLGKQIKIKNLDFESTEGDVVYFKQGSYDLKNGKVVYTEKDFHFVLRRLTALHKSNTNAPLYWLNIFFGTSLLFFAVSAFWMFKPNVKVFKNGIKMSAVGMIFTLLVLYFAGS